MEEEWKRDLLRSLDEDEEWRKCISRKDAEVDAEQFIKSVVLKMKMKGGLATEGPATGSTQNQVVIQTNGKTESPTTSSEKLVAFTPEEEWKLTNFIHKLMNKPEAVPAKGPTGKWWNRGEMARPLVGNEALEIETVDSEALEVGIVGSEALGVETLGSEALMESPEAQMPGPEHLSSAHDQHQPDFESPVGEYGHCLSPVGEYGHQRSPVGEYGCQLQESNYQSGQHLCQDDAEYDCQWETEYGTDTQFEPEHGFQQDQNDASYFGCPKQYILMNYEMKGSLEEDFEEYDGAGQLLEHTTRNPVPVSAQYPPL